MKYILLQLESGNKINLEKMKANRPPHLADKAAEIEKAEPECAEKSKHSP